MINGIEITRDIKMDFSLYVQFCVVKNILKQFCCYASGNASCCQNKKAGIQGLVKSPYAALLNRKGFMSREFS
jgi:hypothetical protein